MKKQGFIKRLVYSKSFFAIGLIILILFTLTLGKRILERHKINQEIKELKQEIEKLENRNGELLKLIEYLNTSSYIEEAARIKLGLQKPGESVVIVPKEFFSENKANGDLVSSGIDEQAKEESNVVKWWKYFFKK